jgi:hypothetical protein
MAMARPVTEVTMAPQCLLPPNAKVSRRAGRGDATRVEPRAARSVGCNGSLGRVVRLPAFGHRPG